MARPRKPRCIAAEPGVTYFKPLGIPLRELEEVTMSVEELEALRLADLEGLSTEAGAEAMRVSRHTFGRVLRQARRVVSEALVRGRALRIAGGQYRVADPPE